MIMATTTSTQSVELTVNEQLVKLENLLQAIEYLHEAQRNTPVLTKEEAMEAVSNFLSDETFFRRIRDWIKRYKMQELANGVADDIKEFIGPRLDAYIDQKLRERGM